MKQDSLTGKIERESVPGSFLRVLLSPYLRTTALRCIASIVRYFFLLQYRAALLPGRVPVSRADHPLDEKIPFLPAKVNIYLDFVAFWVRTIGFLLRTCGRRALPGVKHFLETMGGLYAFAAEVYAENLSTTKRPFYIARPRFFLIHAVDPHLMCIPSLHVMVVIRTYTLFGRMIEELGEGERFAPELEELKRGALAISGAVLYVKQHSVNCISAAMYAMTRFDPALFPPDEAGRFAGELFAGEKAPAGLLREEILAHIQTLYRRFLAEGEQSPDWKKPLLDFLKNLPRV